MEEGRSLRERMEISVETINKACDLSMKAHKICVNQSNQYICKEICSLSQIVFAFRGSWSVNGWFSRGPFGEKKIDHGLFPSLGSIGNQESALVNEAFFGQFVAILRNSQLITEVEKAVKDGKQLVFAGHSSGGPLAMLATLWFLETYTRRYCATTPLCVTFGSPLLGDRIFPHAIRRENWDHCFINFVNIYDIVPLIMFAPLSSIDQELSRILDFHNPNSAFYKHAMISSSSETSLFYENLLTKASLVASYTACSFRGSGNLLVGKFSNFVELSPYRPFGTYIFCNEDQKSVVMANPDAVLQTLFYFSRLSSEKEGSMVDCRRLSANLRYENVSTNCLVIQNVVSIERASDLVAMETKSALHDIGLNTEAILSLHAALSFEEKKLKNEKAIDMEGNNRLLQQIQEYKNECEDSKFGYYEAYKMQSHECDFLADVARLQLAGIWDEIVDMLKKGELPDSFEGKKSWIELGTRYRRLLEPLDVSNYYRHGRNDDAGSYLDKGRPRRYKFPQRWLEHDQGMMRFATISESCFMGEVEELKFISRRSHQNIKERIVRLEGQVLKWYETGVLEKDVLLDTSTFAKWWSSLPEEHKLESCIKDLFVDTTTTSD